MQICDYDEDKKKKKKKKILDPNLDTACPAGISCKYNVSFLECLLDLTKKKLFIDFLVNFGKFGVFHGHKQLFTVQNCVNVQKHKLESQTVSSFDIFKKEK